MIFPPSHQCLSVELPMPLEGEGDDIFPMVIVLDSGQEREALFPDASNAVMLVDLEIELDVIRFPLGHQ